MERAGGGVHELGRNGVGADPAHLGVFAWFAVLGLAGPMVSEPPRDVRRRRRTPDTPPPETPGRLIGPGGDSLVSASLGGGAVAEVGVGEGVDALVPVRVPPDQSVSVLLLGADVVGEVGQGSRGVAGHDAGSGAVDAGVAGLVVVGAEQSVLPSIGSGAFLIPIIERLIASARMPWSRA